MSHTPTPAERERQESAAYQQRLQAAIHRVYAMPPADRVAGFAAHAAAEAAGHRPMPDLAARQAAVREAAAIPRRLFGGGKKRSMKNKSKRKSRKTRQSRRY